MIVLSLRFNQNILEKCNMLWLKYIIGFDQYNNTND